MIVQKIEKKSQVAMKKKERNNIVGRINFTLYNNQSIVFKDFHYADNG